MSQVEYIVWRCISGKCPLDAKGHLESTEIKTERLCLVSCSHIVDRITSEELLLGDI